MADLNYNVSVGTSGAIQSLDNLQKKINKVNDDFNNLGVSFGAIAAGMTAALTGLVASAAAFADEITDVAKANETTAASVLGLASALQGAGGSADSTGRLLQTLSNNIEGANSGNLKLVNTFQRLGVSINDLGSLSQDAIKGKLIKSLAEMTDPIQRNALAMDVFGKAAVGVDWKQVAADIDNNTAKYREYEGALGTAGDAFDKMASIMKDIKIAAAVAFEPLFKYINQLKIDIPTITAVMKAFAAATAAVVSVSVLAGLAKMLALLKDIGVVVSKNKLITLVAAALSVGTAIATWTGLTKDAEDAQDSVAEKIDANTEATENTRRSQEGLNDAIKKEREQLTAIGQQLSRNWENALKRFKFETDSLSLSEDEKKIREAIAKVDEDAANAKFQLQQKFDALTKDQQARNQATYDEELKNIDRNAQAQKRAIEQNITNTQRLMAVMKDYQNTQQILGNSSVKIFDDNAKAAIDSLSSYSLRIDAEGKLAAVTKTREVLMNQLSKVSEEDKQNTIAAITEATSKNDLLDKSYSDINDSIQEHITKYYKLGQISAETYKTIITDTNNARTSVVDANEKIANNTARIAQQSRTFSSGWNRAFREYVDNATNAAKQAEKIFAKATQGIEDMLVNFVKTGKFEWKSFVEDMLETLLRSQIQQAMAGIFQMTGLGNLFGGGGGGNPVGQTPNNPMYVYDVGGGGSGYGGVPAMASGGGFGGGGLGGLTNIFSGIGNTISSAWSGITDFFGGFFANGGTLGAGRWGIAGEMGPELISGPATITPMGMGTNVTYNINAVDAASFKALVAADPSFIHAVAMQGAAAIPGRR